MNRTALATQRNVVAATTRYDPIFGVSPETGPGILEVGSSDCFIDWRVETVRDNVTTTRWIRTGPAGSFESIPVDRGARVSYRVANLLAAYHGGGLRADPRTGLLYSGDCTAYVWCRFVPHLPMPEDGNPVARAWSHPSAMPVFPPLTVRCVTGSTLQDRDALPANLAVNLLYIPGPYRWIEWYSNFLCLFTANDPTVPTVIYAPAGAVTGLLPLDPWSCLIYGSSANVKPTLIRYRMNGS